MQRLYRKSKGFTLLEMLVIVAIIGILITVALPRLRGTTYSASSKQIDDFVHSVANNWRLANQECGTSNNVASSALVATPSATNSLALMVNGTAYLNATYTGCFSRSGVVPLVGKATGNAADGFRVGGFSVTWSGGGTGTPISFTIANLNTDVALPLYNQYSSFSGAQNATALEALGDATDPVIRYTAPSGGTTNLTFLIY